MTTQTTVTLVPTTANGTAIGNYDGTSDNFVSDKVKGDGYYGFTDGLHTVQIRTTDFVGVIKLQASLVTDPQAADWSDISGVVIGDGSTVTTGGEIFNFTGNYVWIRAQIESFTAGTINSVLFAR